MPGCADAEKSHCSGCLDAAELERERERERERFRSQNRRNRVKNLSSNEERRQYKVGFKAREASSVTDRQNGSLGERERKS